MLYVSMVISLQSDFCQKLCSKQTYPKIASLNLKKTFWTPMSIVEYINDIMVICYNTSFIILIKCLFLLVIPVYKFHYKYHLVDVWWIYKNYMHENGHMCVCVYLCRRRRFTKTPQCKIIYLQTKLCMNVYLYLKI